MRCYGDKPAWFFKLNAATRCNTLQHIATRAATHLQHTPGEHAVLRRQACVVHEVECCNTLQHTLQHTATHAATRCNTLQHTPGEHAVLRRQACVVHEVE